jgi:Phage P22-like portal protein
MANSLDSKDDGSEPSLGKFDAGMNKLPDQDGSDERKKKAPKLAEESKPKDKRSSEKKRKEKILKRLVKRFNRCVKWESDKRTQALEDRKFVAGDQWSSDDMARRKDDKRPCLTVNKLPTFIHQITNDQRQNRPSINISPVGDRGDVEAAKMYRGTIRYLERASNADIAYDTAFNDAVTSGEGFFRILTERESPETFNQTIVWRRIRNPFTVYLDPDHQEPDGADCRFGFITELVPKEEFEDQWPDASLIPFVDSGAGENKNWVDSENIRVCEAYEITQETKTLVALSNGWVGFKEDIIPEAQAQIDAGLITIDREGEAQVPSCMWYKFTQVDILDETPWPGRWVPIIKVIGDELDVEGKVKYSGVVRHAKDAQRMVNYWSTAEAEQLGLAPKAPFIMEEGQVEGHEAQWKQANVKAYPYLLYKGTNVAGKQAPPPQRQPPIGIPAGVVQAKQGAAQDMMATTGIRFDATMQERTVDESGRALREIRRTGDIGSFHYVDNLSRSLKHAGEIVLDLIPKIIDTKRIMTILREDDTEEQVEFNPTASKAVTETRHPETGKVKRIFNPTVGKYGVTVTIGPSYATKRIEASESMMDFIRALPETGKFIADLVAKNQDWPGAEEIARRIAKTIPPQMLAPDQKDMTPQTQALLQAMDAQIKQLLQERQAMVKLLTDQNAERALEQDKINKDFEAKLLSVVQKSEASFEKQVGAQMSGLIDTVNQLMQGLHAPQPPGAVNPGPSAPVA